MSAANMTTDCMDIAEAAEAFMKTIISGQNPIKTSSTCTWLPEKRAKYNAKRRQMDLDFVYSCWDLPREMTETKINITEVPVKVAKKHKRTIAVHGNEWTRRCGNAQLFKRWSPGQWLKPKTIPLLGVHLPLSRCERCCPHICRAQL